MRHAVIMAGGSGTRLWPLSRQSEPKQLLPLIDGRSLLELAGDRLEGARLEGGQLVGAISPERRFVCAVEIHRARILASLPWLKDDHFLGEPEGRDTLNAVGFAAAISSLDDADATLAVLTADHRIEPQSEFARALELAFRLVESQPTRFATFGITPSFAATGYGWVERGEAIQISPTGASAPTRDAGAAGAFVAKSFVEKPDRARAEQFLASGRHSWNSGMFVFHAETLLRAIEWFRPESAKGLREIAAAWKSSSQAATIARVYPALPKTSIDVGVMEPASRDPRLSIAVVPMSVRWSDVGSWATLAETLAADDAGNRTTGARALHLDSRRVTVVGDDPSHLVATIGCEDLVIVRTKDATLVCRAADAERVKELAQRVPPPLR